MKLVAATLETFGRADHSSGVVVEDILQASRVSRATFYTYFKSVEDAIKAVGDELIDEFTAGMEELRAGVGDDPVRQAAVTHHLFLVRAAMQPGWGAYMAHWDQFGRVTEAEAPMVTNLKRGRREGVFRFVSIFAATDFIAASMLGACKRLIRWDNFPLAYICEVQEMILVGLGVSRERAHDAVVFAAAYIEERRGQFPWWNSLETKNARELEE